MLKFSVFSFIFSQKLYNYLVMNTNILILITITKKRKLMQKPCHSVILGRAVYFMQTA